MSQAAGPIFLSAAGSSNSSSLPITSVTATRMTALTSSDLVVVVLFLALGSLYLFKDSLFVSKSKDIPIAGKFAGGANVNGAADAGVDSRDFVAKLKATVCSVLVQTCHSHW